MFLIFVYIKTIMPLGRKKSSLVSAKPSLAIPISLGKSLTFSIFQISLHYSLSLLLSLFQFRHLKRHQPIHLLPQSSTRTDRVSFLSLKSVHSLSKVCMLYTSFLHTYTFAFFIHNALELRWYWTNCGCSADGLRVLQFIFDFWVSYEISFGSALQLIGKCEILQAFCFQLKLSICFFCVFEINAWFLVRLWAVRFKHGLKDGWIQVQEVSCLMKEYI